jgi:ATP-dependent RNA helicase RhlE
VQVASKSASPDKINQCVYHVRRAHKPQLLTHVLTREYVGRALVFTRTKHGADKLVRHLYKEGIHAEAIHGNKRQNVRQRTLANFKSGRTSVLVATDIAARGIDVDEVTHVVNFDMPNEPETYVHRIGRTGRAGASGLALSFCDHGERNDLKSIERLLKRPIEVKVDHPEYAALPEGSFDDAVERRPARAGAGGPPGWKPARPQRRSRPDSGGRGERSHSGGADSGHGHGHGHGQATPHGHRHGQRPKRADAGHPAPAANGSRPGPRGPKPSGPGKKVSPLARHQTRVKPAR